MMQGHIHPNRSGFKAASPYRLHNPLKLHTLQNGTAVAFPWVPAVHMESFVP